MTGEHPRRRHADRTEVRLPRSLVVSFAVSILTLVIVGIIGIVVTYNRAASASTDTRDVARCMLLQQLEQRAYTYAADRAAADFHGYDFDDDLPVEARPPALDKVLAELDNACDEFVAGDLLEVRTTPRSTTSTIVAVPGPAGPAGSPGAPGAAGRDTSPNAPSDSTAPGTTSSTTTTTTRRSVVVPIPTIPIASALDPAQDRYAAGMSIAAAFGGAILLIVIAGAGLLRVRQLRIALTDHPSRRHPR